MELGVCYYPEHWPPSRWAVDAKAMVAMGLSWVRMGEFAWSRIEPDPGEFNWAWLDEAIDTLHHAGLKVVLGTPTATPPKWLIDAHPDILARDLQGRLRGFGSRRHYCFSSPRYRQESQRITRAVATRYGHHPGIAAWQTDNEYGCHDTVLSTSAAALRGFRAWLARRYASIEALNLAWGNVFWSQELRSFDEVELPVGTVTEANPSQYLDWRRFASDEVVAFNREQANILRELSPGRPVTHNFMGFFTEFNHHDVAADLDVATWDSYPLGFTQNFFFTPTEKTRWARIGHPDIAAFHHDLYRGMCPDQRWWVMEQQPGPVNWAQWNPAPASGMVRLWTWQAFAHGAEVVSYFRWRQLGFGQEQMHAGLLATDASMAPGGLEAATVGQEIASLKEALASSDTKIRNAVAMVFDYDSQWMANIQPQGKDYAALELSFRIYSALRQCGLDVDIVHPKADLNKYRMLVLPAQLHVSEALANALKQSKAHIVLAPRTASKSPHLHHADPSHQAAWQAWMGLKVGRVESLPPGLSTTVRWPDGRQAQASRWRDELVLTTAQALATDDEGQVGMAQHGTITRVGVWLDDAGWRHVLSEVAQAAGLAPVELPDHLRISRRGALTLAFNFSNLPVRHDLAGHQALLGSNTIAPLGLSIWRRSSV